MAKTMYPLCYIQGTIRHRAEQQRVKLLTRAFQQKMELPSSTSEDEDYANGNQPVIIGEDTSDSASRVSSAVSRLHRDFQIDHPELQLEKTCAHKFHPSGNLCGKPSGSYAHCPHHREKLRLKSRRQRVRRQRQKLLDDNMSDTTKSVLNQDYMRQIVASQTKLLKSKAKLQDAVASFEDNPQLQAKLRESHTALNKEHQQTQDACRIIAQKPHLVDVLKSGSNVKEMTDELVEYRRLAKRCSGTKHVGEKDKWFALRCLRERLDYAETCDKRHQLMLYVVKELLDNYDVMCPHEKLFKEKPMFGEHPLNRCPNMCRELEGCPVPPPPSKLSRVRSVLPSWLGGNAPPQKRARE
jgi:hypothetical protein